MIYYFYKLVAKLERIIANAGNTIANSYASKARAITERTISNASNAIRDSYTSKARATLERIFINCIFFTVIILGKYKLGIITYVTKKVIYTVISIEKIVVIVNYLTFTCMYVYCITCYVSVIR